MTKLCNWGSKTPAVMVHHMDDRCLVCKHTYGDHSEGCTGSCDCGCDHFYAPGHQGEDALVSFVCTCGNDWGHEDYGRHRKCHACGHDFHAHGASCSGSGCRDIVIREEGRYVRLCGCKQFKITPIEPDDGSYPPDPLDDDWDSFRPVIITAENNVTLTFPQPITAPAMETALKALSIHGKKMR